MYKKYKTAVDLLGLFRAPEPRISDKRKSPKLLVSERLRQISTDEQFSVFNNEHTEEARHVMNQLLEAEDNTLFVAMCKELREQVESEVYFHCISVASYHRKDTKHFRLPPVFETHAADFFPHDVIREPEPPEIIAETPVLEFTARDGGGTRSTLATVLATPRAPTRREGAGSDPGAGSDVRKPSAEGSRDDDAEGVPRAGDVVLETDKDDSDRGVEADVGEEALRYFREDICLNSHHWHWHSVYPTAEGMPGVFLHRRGELFYYMHKQMLARYDAERLSNGLSPVRAYSDWAEIDPEGYDPRLPNFAARPKNWQLSPDFRNDLQTLLDHVDSDQAEMEGLDFDGRSSRIERSIHNTGHGRIAGWRPGVPRRTVLGVMASERTAIRDPIFFRWHKFIDELIQRQKTPELQEPYTTEEVTWEEVTLRSLQVLDTAQTQTSELRTFLRKRVIDISYSWNLSSTNERKVTIRHLDHERFSYQLDMNNSTQRPLWATVRVFLLPKYGEKKQEYNMDDFVTKSIEMDKFTEEVPPGQHTIVRHSSASSVIIPWVQTFGQLYNNLEENETKEEDYCGCGWPENLQIPRGNQDGWPCHVLALLTDWQRDKAQPTFRRPPTPPVLTSVDDDGVGRKRKNAASYCGLRGKRYPDNRAMGFPFDRPSARAESLQEFVSGKGNVKVTGLVIRHEDQVVE